MPRKGVAISSSSGFRIVSFFGGTEGKVLLLPGYMLFGHSENHPPLEFFCSDNHPPLEVFVCFFCSDNHPPLEVSRRRVKMSFYFLWR